MPSAAHTQRQTATPKPRSSNGAKAATSPGLAALQRAADDSVSTSRQGALQAVADANQPARAGGLPGPLKSGIERLSGVAMDDVNVHRNSGAPGRIGALATAQGRDIHLAPGQERHLPHEAWHVAQQAQGRVQATTQFAGAAINADRALEHEADVMGERAVQEGGMAAPVAAPTQLRRPASHSNVTQPLLGFEIEMLVLIDNNGRPLPEKQVQGKVGQHIDIDVDHGSLVDAPTPRPAALARYDVDAHAAHVGKPVEMRPNAGAETRPPLGGLSTANWRAATDAGANPEFTRPNSAVLPAIDNTPLQFIDAEIAEYNFSYENWEPARAQADLGAVIAGVAAWHVRNPKEPPGYQRTRRRRWRRVRNAVDNVHTHAFLQRNFWASPVNANPPAHYRREVFDAAANGGAGQWDAYQPAAGMGNDRYASIVELVTEAYAPETAAGAANIHAAMQDAAAFAAAVQRVLPARTQLNTLTNVNNVGAGVHIGNPAQPAQTTNGSVQVTGALDLAQLPSFMLSVAGTGGPGLTDDLETNSIFRLKHHSDTDDDEGRQALTEMPLAVANATAAVNAIKGGVNDPSLVNLRGLVTLICQYLRFGKHFYSGAGQALDKNIVPLLSRTDLSTIYGQLVPPAEQVWLTPGRLATLQAQILVQTGRAGTSRLFNDVNQTNPHMFGADCQTFVDNVFNAGADGVTGAFGGFRKMAPESVDPSQARGGDTRPAAAPERQGFVFEMRNMVKRDWDTLGRFPPNRWPTLAAQQVALFKSLNARAEAAAVQDTQARRVGWGQPAGGNYYNTNTQNKPAW